MGQRVNELTFDVSHRRDVNTAKSLLNSIDKRRSVRSEVVRQRVLAVFALLEVLLSRLPEEPAESDMHEIERIVAALRSADANLGHGARTAGVQALELAKARTERLAARLIRAGAP